MTKRERPNRVLLGIALALVLIATAIGLIYFKTFTGWFYHAASAGTITAMNIHQTYSADAWHGFGGMAMLDFANTQTNWNYTVTGATTTHLEPHFNCFGKSGFDLYLSPVPADQLNLSTVSAATVGEIDAYIGIDPTDRMSATRTFNETFTINLGGNLITGPGVRTKTVSNLTNIFHQVALKDANGVIFFGANASKAIPGFSGHMLNFQMMVPVPFNESSITYYLFPDPVTDILGECEEWNFATLKGYVTSKALDTPLSNVTIQVGSAITETDALGYYEVLAEIGTRFVLGYKKDYFDYVNFTTITGNTTNWHNFSMAPTLNETSPFNYGYISGQVFGINGTPIVNATVMTGLHTDATDVNGSFTVISLAEEDSLIMTIKDGYRTNVSYVNVTSFNYTYINITLSEAPAVFGGNGTVYGKVLDGGNNQSIENATVRVGSWQTLSNGTGDYEILVPSYSYYYIIGHKDLYDPVVGELTGNNSVTPGSRIHYDIYMNESNYLTGLFEQPPGKVGAYTEPPGQNFTSNMTEEDVAKDQSEYNGTGMVIENTEGKIAAYLSIRQIKTHIKQDSFVEQTIAFYNFKDSDLDIDLAIEGEELGGVFSISDDQITISPNQYGELELTMVGTKPPGVYRGKLLVSGGIDAELPIEIRISKEGKIPIKTLMLKLDVLKKMVVQGTPVKYKLDMVNLFTDRKYDVDLKFYLADINGTKISDFSEKSIILETFTSLVGQIMVPDDLEPGDYIVRAQADYLGLTSTTDALFSVREPFYSYNLLGILPVWLLATLLALVAMSLFTAQEIKRRREAKKRFHAKVEYDELPQEGDRSLFVGNIAETTKKSYFDMDRLTVHSIVAGSTGGGKSISAQDIIEECLLRDVAVAVFDPTAQWSGMLRKLEDKKFLEFYPKFGMDPKKDPRGFNGNIKAVKNGREIIDIFKYLRPGEIQIFTTNTLDPKDYDIFVASMIQQIFHSKLDEFRGLKYLLVFDEIHRILPKFGGSGAGFTQIERGCREFRKWGIGIVLISQVLSDFVGEIKANINTLVQMKTRDEGDLDRIKMQYGEEYIQSLVKSPVGSGMVQNSSWNRGKPYYITFRPILHSVVRLSDEELDKYNKYNEIVEQLEFEFDQLEEAGQDVFDLRLELKLSKDKIKSGNFNMVQIYLDGLTPRVQKMWDKLGKTPKKLEIQLLDTEAIDEAVKKAKEEKAKKEKEEGGGEDTSAEASAEKPTETSTETAKEKAPKEAAPAQPVAISSTAKPSKPDIPTASTAPANPAARAAKPSIGANSSTKNFNAALAKTKQAIQSNNRPVAVQTYKQLANAYQTLSQQQKPTAFKHLSLINKQIAGMK